MMGRMCQSEKEQLALIERFQGEGLACKALLSYPGSAKKRRNHRDSETQRSTQAGWASRQENRVWEKAERSLAAEAGRVEWRVVCQRGPWCARVDSTSERNRLQRG
jgi:hypothetical protein